MRTLSGTTIHCITENFHWLDFCRKQIFDFQHSSSMKQASYTLYQTCSQLRLLPSCVVFIWLWIHSLAVGRLVSQAEVGWLTRDQAWTAVSSTKNRSGPLEYGNYVHRIAIVAVMCFMNSSSPGDITSIMYSSL